MLLRLLAVLQFASSEIALSADDLEKFTCRQNAWQLPQSCGANCGASDQTTHRLDWPTPQT